MKSTRRKHNPDFKAKVALAALKGDKTLADLGTEYGLHTHQILAWKKTMLENASAVFDKSSNGKTEDKADNSAELLQKIGQLTVERDFLARKLGH